MRVLVTGGSGYLGAHIASDLLKRGHEVVLLNRRPHPEFGPWLDQFEVRLGDVATDAATLGVCRGVDVVIHTAAVNARESEANTELALAVNGYGTRNVLGDAVRENVKLFIYLSTFHVYGPPQTVRIAEAAPPNPVSNYALTHYLAELFCRQYAFTHGLPAVILRLSNGYGAPLFQSADCWTLVLNDFCRRAVEEGVIQLKTTGVQKRDFVAIPDILQAINLFIDGAGGLEGADLFNVGAGRSLSVRDLAALTATVYEELLGRPAAVHFSDQPPTAAELRDFVYDIGRIRALGYEPRADMRTEIKNLLLFLEGAAR